MMENSIVTRSGKTTSEFWSLILFVAVIILNGTPYVDIPSEYIMMLATIIFGYGGGRTLLKNSLIKNDNALPPPPRPLSDRSQTPQSPQPQGQAQ